MEILHTLATLFPLALTSGINLYATILVAGLCIHFGWVTNTPPGLDPLGSWFVIIASAIFYFVEALADKIPFLDNLWDMLHTIIRPLGAAILALAVLGKADPILVIVGILAIGSITLVSHGGKASARVVMNVLTPYENFSNIGVSVAEDVIAGGITFLALKYPYLATGITLVILIVILIFAPQLLRWMFFTMKASWKRVKGLFNQQSIPDQLPMQHHSQVNFEDPEKCVIGVAHKIKNGNNNEGYLCLYPNRLAFTYSKRFSGNQVWQILLGSILSTRYNKRGLVDILELSFEGAKGQIQIARFTFMKDRSKLAEDLSYSLQRKIAILKRAI